MEAQEQAIKQLRRAVERTLGRKMQTNKDFDCLADSIYEKTHAKISTTTLKRIWGYLSEGVTPRRYTLDQLAHFVGYDDFDAFCASLENGNSPKPSPANADTASSPLPAGEGLGVGLTPSLWGRVGVGLALFLFLFLLLFLFLRSAANHSSDDDRILKKGQVFATYDDFLPLFGIDATESQHYQYVPGEEHIVVWSPQYHNPYYHNDGNPDSLMPTITEYYTPKYEGRDFVDMKETIRQKQKESYSTMAEKNDIRIVFMKDLVDTSFVFLGAYRFSLELSDTTKIVWIRAHDECDLDNISFLNNYRN
ncbi:MAG: hypothetical protein J5971_00555 [Prevotella sp.]|nr:hypothetical protein [Prevotella sp.]